MNTLTIEHVGAGLYVVRYNGYTLPPRPWFRITDALVLAFVRWYRDEKGVGA